MITPDCICTCTFHHLRHVIDALIKVDRFLRISTLHIHLRVLMIGPVNDYISRKTCQWVRQRLSSGSRRLERPTVCMSIPAATASLNLDAPGVRILSVCGGGGTDPHASAIRLTAPRCSEAFHLGESWSAIEHLSANHNSAFSPPPACVPIRFRAPLTSAKPARVPNCRNLRGIGLKTLRSLSVTAQCNKSRATSLSRHRRFYQHQYCTNRQSPISDSHDHTSTYPSSPQIAVLKNSNLLHRQLSKYTTNTHARRERDNKKALLNI